MKLNERIKRARTNKGWSQEILASKVYVTRQAVAKWESGDNEPSIEMLKLLAAALEVSLIYLVEGKEEIIPNDSLTIGTISRKDKEEIVESIAEKVKPAIGICEVCHKVITDPDDYHERKGARHHKKIFCSSCYERKKVVEIAERKRNLKKRRSRSFVWGTISALAFFVITLLISLQYARSYLEIGIGVSILGALLMFTFISCCFLGDNFIGLFWLETMSYGFVKMPGIIFSLDLGGIIFLLTVKLFLWILGIMIALVIFFIATLLGMVFSIFVYPFALKKNIQNSR